MKRIFNFLSGLALVFFFGCQTENRQPLDTSNSQEKPYVFTNDAATLDQLVTYPNLPVNIRSIGTSGGRLEGRVNPALVSEIASPLINGTPIMATAIAKADGVFVASYSRVMVKGQ